MTKFLILLALALIAWRLWQTRGLRRQQPPSPGGFSADPERLVRCERCGVRVPASEIGTVRANCRQCSGAA